jgi:hypothetical protein
MRTQALKIHGNARVTVQGLRATTRAVKHARALEGPSALGADPAGDLGKRLKEAGNLVAGIARGNASFSSRIPGSIRVGGGRSGVVVRAGSTKAPHAYAFELGKRHPLFGKTGPGDWFPTAHIPFLENAAVAGFDAAAEIVAQVIDDWAAENGFE